MAPTGPLTAWVAPAPGETFLANGRLWHVHLQGPSGSILAFDQDSVLPTHLRATVGQSGAPADRSVVVQRAEMAPADGSGLARGVVHWLGYSFKIDGQAPDGAALASGGGWCSLLQIHQTPDPGEYEGPQPFGLYWMGDGSLRAVRRYDPRATTTPQSFTTVETLLTPRLETGVWHHVEVRAVLDDGAAARGALTIWLDGSQRLSLTGIPFGFNDVADPYPKVGIYRASSSGVMVAEFDQVSIGTADLSGRTMRARL